MKNLDAKIAALSPRARKLYGRLCDGHFYFAYGVIPRAMGELKDAGLVTIETRVVEMANCYVPAGTKRMRCERLPPRPAALAGQGA